MLTTFNDRHSGGRAKENFELLVIRAPKEEAVRQFTERFGHSPDNVTCECCGSDYAVSEWAENEVMDYIGEDKAFELKPDGKLIPFKL